VTRRVPARIAYYATLVLLSVLALAPTLWVVLSSFTTGQRIYSGKSYVPIPFTLDGYADVFAEVHLQRYLLNSFVYATGATAGALVVGLLAAYPTVRMRFPFRRTTTTVFALGLAIPIISLIVPEYFVLLKTGMYDTKAGLTLFYVALFFPLAFVMLRAYLVQIPVDVEEAARVEGAGYFTILWKVVTPLARPGLATVAVIVFISVWNEFLFALVLAPSSGNENVQIALTTFKAQFQYNVSGMLAGTTLVMLVPVAAFLLLQRQVIAGLAAGATK
jgi:ABC-type glycerol-3-phosphate transport system permease component